MAERIQATRNDVNENESACWGIVTEQEVINWSLSTGTWDVVSMRKTITTKDPSLNLPSCVLFCLFLFSSISALPFTSLPRDCGLTDFDTSKKHTVRARHRNHTRWTPPLPQKEIALIYGPQSFLNHMGRCPFSHAQCAYLRACALCFLLPFVEKQRPTCGRRNWHAKQVSGIAKAFFSSSCLPFSLFLYSLTHFFLWLYFLKHLAEKQRFKQV